MIALEEYIFMYVSYLLLTVGTIALLALLITLWRVTSLSQRNNPFLVNLLLTTWLSTIPALLLLFSGHAVDLAPAKPLCILQAVLMDGVAPMFGIAGLCLVLNTSLQISADLGGHFNPLAEKRWLRIFVLSIPYITYLCWTSASIGVGLSTPPQVVVEAIWCAIISPHSNRIRRFIGFFVTGFSLSQLMLEGWIIALIIKHKKTSSDITKSKNSLTIEKSLIARVIVFTLIQLTILILTVILSGIRIEDNPQNYPHISPNITRVFESMNPLFTFLVFGTSNSLLEAWHLKKAPSVQSDFREVERGWDQNIDIDYHNV
ncbi:hypothetical protein M422DRAFT_776009 [Sphaerobolus stellatus SS14]|nr:hypothetical protein M422DRAFT_776009 [Sphaerobolus stellatus SS14]